MGLSKFLTRILSQENLLSAKTRRFTYYALLLTLISHVLIVGLLCFTPPISRDALIHHLAIPKLWLKHGGFYEIPWAVYSYYPMNINLLYLVSLYFNNDIAPKFIHFAFGLGTALLVYSYLKQRLNRNWALLGMIIFITTPIVIWLSTSAYVDLGMAFFTTGSILALIRWRDSGYSQSKWLILSSCCMGIALGSKYNALIAWLFLNLLVVYSYARDTQRQLPALKYGIIFFLITWVVASPWYVKNGIQTGNPFYPLFDSFFELFRRGGVPGGVLDAATKSVGTNFFQMREMMYGESLGETLLIPIRMFFQGSDYNYQYFQGVLNPVLIIFLPFAIISMDNRKDSIFFVAFCAFFIIIGFFMTAKQVRYLLPVIPFLSIIAVIGIKNVTDILPTTERPFKDSVRFYSSGVRNIAMLISRVSLFVIVGILLIFNFSYLKVLFDKIQPLTYVLQKETRDAFLRRHLGSYPAMDYINRSLPADADVFLMFLGRRGYYLDRSYRFDGSFGMTTINSMVNAAFSEAEFRTYAQSLNCTHILIRTDLFNKYLQDNFSRETIARFLGLIRQSWRLLYESNGYAIFSVGGFQR